MTAKVKRSCLFCRSHKAAFDSLEQIIEAIKSDKEFHPEEDMKMIGRVEAIQEALSSVTGFCMCGEKQPRRH